MSRLRTEDGFLTVTAALLLVVALAIGGLATAAGVRGKASQRRDADVKRAVQAADAGIASTVYILNQLNLSTVNFNGGLSGLGNTLICPNVMRDEQETYSLPIGTVAYDVSAGNCPPSGGPPPNGFTFTEDYGHGASVTTLYEPDLQANNASSRLGGYVISTGVADGVRRRVRAQLSDVDPLRTVDALGSVRLRAADNLENLLVTVAGDVRSNDRVRFQGSGIKAVVAPPGLTSGTIQHRNGVGPDPGATGLDPLTAATVTQLTAPFTRNGIEIADDKPICPTTPCALPANSIFEGHSFKWDEATPVVFAAGDYVFCSFSLRRNGRIEIPLLADGAVRIFIDRSRCPASFSGAGDFVVRTGTEPELDLLGVTLDPGDINATPIVNPNAGAASTFQVYLVGDADPQLTKLTYRPGVDAGNGLLSTVLSAVAGVLPLPVVFYAPRSDVHVQNANLVGSITGYNVLLDGRTTLEFDPDLLNIPLTNSTGTFHVRRYVECASRQPDILAGDAPDADC